MSNGSINATNFAPYSESTPQEIRNTLDPNRNTLDLDMVKVVRIAVGVLLVGGGIALMALSRGDYRLPLGATLGSIGGLFLVKACDEETQSESGQEMKTSEEREQARRQEERYSHGREIVQGIDEIGTACCFLALFELARHH